MLTIAEAVARSEQLQPVSDSARLDCEVLLCHVLEKDRAYLYTWPEKLLDDNEYAAFDRLFLRRLQGEPIAHITGCKEFWSLSLSVNNSTLIPRPETEKLVELALELLPPNDACTIADLGTGTGAIALAIATERPQWTVWAVEKHEAALQLARENANQLGLTNIVFCQSDWLQQVEQNSFDFIVANPPYIEADDHYLNEGDVRFEPASALVAGNKGLADIETIIQQAPAYLVKQGWLALEHGYQQASAVRALFSPAIWQMPNTYTDLAGHPRATLAQLT